MDYYSNICGLKLIWANKHFITTKFDYITVCTIGYSVWKKFHELMVFRRFITTRFTIQDCVHSEIKRTKYYTNLYKKLNIIKKINICISSSYHIDGIHCMIGSRTWSHIPRYYSGKRFYNYRTYGTQCTMWVETSFECFPF